MAIIARRLTRRPNSHASTTPNRTGLQLWQCYGVWATYPGEESGRRPSRRIRCGASPIDYSTVRTHRCVSRAVPLRGRDTQGVAIMHASTQCSERNRTEQETPSDDVLAILATALIYVVGVLVCDVMSVCFF